MTIRPKPCLMSKLPPDGLFTVAIATCHSTEHKKLCEGRKRRFLGLISGENGEIGSKRNTRPNVEHCVVCCLNESAAQQRAGSYARFDVSQRSVASTD